jgi:hypothetical protein
VDGRLDRSADVLVDQFAERDGLKLLRPRFFLDTLAHGVFLRWPPCKAARWSCTSPTGRMRHFSFPPDSGHDRHKCGKDWLVTRTTVRITGPARVYAVTWEYTQTVQGATGTRWKRGRE